MIQLRAADRVESGRPDVSDLSLACCVGERHQAGDSRRAAADSLNARLQLRLRRFHRWIIVSKSGCPAYPRENRATRGGDSKPRQHSPLHRPSFFARLGGRPLTTKRPSASIFWIRLRKAAANDAAIQRTL